MPSDTSPDLLVDDSPAARRVSATLVVIAAVATAANLLILTPRHFSEAHLADHTPLRYVIDTLSLFGLSPTPKGTELRNTIFYVGAALLAMTAGIRLLTNRHRPRISTDDLLDVRARAGSPYTWYIFFLFCAVLSSSFSHAPRLTLGQTAIHFFHVAWWLPLAALLTPAHVRRLAATLLAVLAAVAAYALWYFLQRVVPQSGFDTRISFPIGNELWLAACLLPGPFLAAGMLRPPLRRVAAVSVAAVLILAVLYLTNSRSAAVGLAAGLAMAFFILSGRVLRVCILVVIISASVAFGWWLHAQRTTGEMGARAHSIRARLNYEWPYALALWSQKRVLGHGDGAYSLLAGQFARVDQLDDPNAIGFSRGANREENWIQHAHNEFLELLSDVGIVGMLAFAAALAVTLRLAVRYCDRARVDVDRRGDWLFAAGLAAALVALAVEECSTNALRQPGLAPVFLTVWAMLWALVRRERRVRNAAPEEARIKVTTVRMTGAAIAVAAVAMLFIAIQDGRGHRARFKVETALGSGDTESAIRHADSAAAWALDPFHNVAARMFAVWACSADFDRRLIGNAVPFDSDMRVAEDALVRLKSIEDDAPRFLRLSILRSELCMNVARAYQRRNEPKYQADFEHRRNAAFTQRLADDPFEFDNLAAVWVARSEAGSMERLAWLRGLLRSGEMDPRVIELFRSMAALPDFLPALNDLFNLATADQARPVDSWQDRLTPETFRLAALARALNRQHGDAVRFAETADELYTRAGPRLFAPHAAAIHERVRYAFAQDPKADPDEALVQLARANTKMTGPSSADQPLPAPMGYTRLNILLAAGREDEARVELAALPFDASTAQDADARLSAAYVGLAAQFASDRARVPLALGWVRRALELDADSLDAHVTLADIQLRQSDIEPAVATLRRIAAVAPDKATADSRLNLLQARHPDSAAWKELGRASPAATQPEGR